MKFKRIAPGAKLPEYKTPGSVGADLYACEASVLEPGQIKLISTGLKVAYIPPLWMLQVVPRSSLGAKGIIIPNSPGTIDSDYRGELKVLLMNLSRDSFAISVGDRIGQLIYTQTYKCLFEEGEIQESERGAGGFGSTGR